jgi:putative oxidoreductase
MNPALEGPLNLVGRILLALIFFASALGEINDWKGTADYMEQNGVVAIPFFLAGAIVFELFGSLSVAAGVKARYGAFLLVVFLIPASLVFHAFWKIADDPVMARLQMISFMKNVAIMGALLTIIARGSGPWSLDALWSNKSQA